MFKELNKTMSEKLKYGNNRQTDTLKRKKYSKAKENSRVEAQYLEQKFTRTAQEQTQYGKRNSSNLEDEAREIIQSKEPESQSLK